MLPPFFKARGAIYVVFATVLMCSHLVVLGFYNGHVSPKLVTTIINPPSASSTSSWPTPSISSSSSYMYPFLFFSKTTTALKISAGHAFNPFATRWRNVRVRWFETDVEEFYEFVEQQPLLSHDQEMRYGKALKMWMQIENVRCQLQLSSNATAAISTAELAAHVGCSESTVKKIIRYGEISRLRLLNSNLKLVLALVSRYRTSNIPNVELIAEGTQGLARAVTRYDYSKGFRFATYATWYVHQAVADYVRLQRHPAKMPSRYLLLHRKVKQFSSEYRSQHTRMPTVPEISAALSESPFDVNKVLSMNTFPTLLTTSLSRGGGYKQESDRTVEDVLPSEFHSPDNSAINRDVRRNVESLMNAHLSDAERDILCCRLGFDDGREKAVKEVGRRFQISWKQVKNLEQNALSKLKLSREATELAVNYLDASV